MNRKFYSYLYINDNKYGYSSLDYDVFRKKIDEGIKRNIEILRMFNYSTRGELYGLEEKWNREYKLFKLIGSYSYHSGERLGDDVYDDDEEYEYGGWLKEKDI